MYAVRGHSVGAGHRCGHREKTVAWSLCAQSMFCVLSVTRAPEEDAEDACFVTVIISAFTGQQVSKSPSLHALRGGGCPLQTSSVLVKSGTGEIESEIKKLRYPLKIVKALEEFMVHLKKKSFTIYSPPSSSLCIPAHIHPPHLPFIPSSPHRLLLLPLTSPSLSSITSPSPPLSLPLPSPSPLR